MAGVLGIIGYIAFSTLETFSYLTFMKALFRFNPKNYFKELVVCSSIVSLLSLLIREELNVVAYFPFIAILVFIVYTRSVLRLPLFWSIIVPGISYIIFLLIQTAIFLGLTSIGAVDMDTARSSSVDQFIVQLSTAGALLLVSIIIYKVNIGFSFDFEKFRFTGENIISISLMVVSFLVVSALLVMNNLTFALIVLLILGTLAIWYGYRKEAKYDFRSGS